MDQIEILKESLYRAEAVIKRFQNDTTKNSSRQFGLETTIQNLTKQNRHLENINYSLAKLKAENEDLVRQNNNL